MNNRNEEVANRGGRIREFEEAAKRLFGADQNLHNARLIAANREDPALRNAALLALAAIRGEVSPSVAEFTLAAALGEHALKKAGVFE